MNRLWMRFALTVTGIVLMVVLVPATLSIIQIYFGLGSPPSEITRLLPEDVTERLNELAITMIPRTLVRIGFSAGLVGIVAGFLLSRNLTAPLRKLEVAAREIGAQNLSRRVTIKKGSDEILAVAAAFNDMAEKLENAESLRQNLLADVAHELRTPLTVLQGNLRAILDDVYPLDKDEVARLYEQTRHLTHLVDDLHELAQAEAHRLPLNKQEINTANLVKEAVAVFEPLAETQGVKLRVELLGKIPVVEADRSRLTQALHNLISNAIRHTTAGETITVQVEKVDSHLHLRVIDNGEGIAAEHLAHVFERFYRTDRSRSRDEGGTGLGLAIVRALIEAHGGQVLVESKGLGEGSIFTLLLPAVEK